MLQSHFHPLYELDKALPGNGQFRQFVGDGTAYLKVPGLLSITAVRVGTTDIPLTLKEEVLIDMSEAAKTEWHEHELIRFAMDVDGIPVVMRSIKSNDGIWQPGVNVYVAGTWADDPEGAVQAESDPIKVAKQALSIAKGKLTKAKDAPDDVKAAAQAEVDSAQKALDELTK
jgi:hypothetical protein